MYKGNICTGKSEFGTVQQLTLVLYAKTAMFFTKILFNSPASSIQTTSDLRLKTGFVCTSTGDSCKS